MLGNVYIRLSLKQAFLYTYNKQVLPKESTLRHHLRFEHHHGVKELLLWSILLNIEKIEREGKYCHPYPIKQDLHVTTVISLTSIYWIPGPSMQLPFFLIWSTYSDIDFWSSYSSSSRLRWGNRFQLISSVLKSIWCVSDDCLLYFLIVTEPDSGQTTNALDNSSVYGDATPIQGIG